MKEIIYRGTILDEQNVITLEEIVQARSCEKSLIVELVNEGVVEPISENDTQWRFTSVSLVKVKVALRLKRDLNINLPGVALVLDLMQEIESLQAHVNRLKITDGEKGH